MKLLSNKEYYDLIAENKSFRDMYNNDIFNLREKKIDLEERYEKLGNDLKYLITNKYLKKDEIVKELKSLIKNMYR